MATVRDLLPGDRVNMNGVEGVLITVDHHPKYTGLALVVWAFKNHPLELKHSFDALSFDQYVGVVLPATPLQRMEALQEVLDGHQA